MSMDIIAGQCRHLLAVARPMLEGLEDAHSGMEPQPGNKTAGWLIGHLCITGDFARRLCGREPIGPREWRNLFSPGTKASSETSAYPSMRELRRVFLEVYSDLPDAFLGAETAAFEAPNPFEPAREYFPTLRQFLPYILTGHFAYHLGQLGDWRRAAGLGHKGRI